jgi:hypothetical protein
MKVVTCSLLALAVISAALADDEDLRIKMQRMHMTAQGHAILESALRAGADVSHVNIKMEHDGEVVKLNGDVPSSNDYNIIQMSAKTSRPFKDIRNFIIIKPPESKKGIAVRERDYTPAVTFDQLKKGLKDCPVCQRGTPCYQLYLEHEKLEKELKDKYLMASDAQRNTYAEEAVKLTTRLHELQQLLDASLCYEIVTGKIDPADARVIIEEQAVQADGK